MSGHAVLLAVWAAGVVVPLLWWFRAGRGRSRPGAGAAAGAGSLSGTAGGSTAGAAAEVLAASRERLLAALAPRLAHEVATPLTAVRGHLDVVADDPSGPAAARSLAVALAELDRVVDLARDLLTLTTVRAGAAPRTRERAAALAEEAVIGLLPLADELAASVELVTTADPVVDVVAGDIIRALRNLVVNALRHGLGTTRAVAVLVEARPGGTVRFTVRDGGPGLDQGQLEGLLAPYARGPLPAGTGSGLGLAIVAEVLAAHGSRLRAERTPPGGAVWFELPAGLAG